MNDDDRKINYWKRHVEIGEQEQIMIIDYGAVGRRLAERQR